MTHRPRLAALVAAALFLAGCAAVSPVAPGTAALVLDAAQTGHFYGQTYTVTLPAGRYPPAYRTADGTYYAAPAPIVTTGVLPGGSAAAGGLFLPRPDYPDQRARFWYEAAPTGRTVPIREPVRFRLAP